MADYNRRFAKPPRVAYDAHRPLRPEDDLGQIFTLQKTRRISRQLTVHYKRDLYVLEDSVANRRLRGATALVSEAEDGTVTIRANGRVLASRLYPKDHAQLAPGAVVDHQRLDGVFAWIAAQQRERDAARLANPKITRARSSGSAPARPSAFPPPVPSKTGHLYLGQRRTFLLCVDITIPGDGLSNLHPERAQRESRPERPRSYARLACATGSPGLVYSICTERYGKISLTPSWEVE